MPVRILISQLGGLIVRIGIIFMTTQGANINKCFIDRPLGPPSARRTIFMLTQNGQFAVFKRFTTFGRNAYHKHYKIEMQYKSETQIINKQFSQGRQRLKTHTVSAVLFIIIYYCLLINLKTSFPQSRIRTLFQNYQ